MNSTANDRDLIATKLDTSIVEDERERIVSQRDPDRSAGPRMLIYGFESGNALRLRADVGSAVAERLSSLVATEPSLIGRTSEPVHRREYVDLLTSEAPVVRHTSGVMFLFPRKFTYTHGVRLICSRTADGDRLTSELQRSDGMPEDLLQLGFDGVEDFWEPWCVAMHADRIASVGFTARLGEHGAESGIVTVPDLRGRGYAAAAVSGWADHPELRAKTLFYSADQSNVSSQKVVERLGLGFIGASFVIF